MILALLLQSAAPPPSPPPGKPQPPATILVEPAAMFLAACDGDGDARVTAAEREGCIARAYLTADGATVDGAGADGAGAGRVGYIAYADWAERWLGDRNALPSPYEVDTDGDNRITLAELQARLGQFAARYDTNRDGQLQRAELVTIRASAPGDDGGRRRRR